MRTFVVYAGEEPPAEWQASIFLAGPTPRSAEVASWRPEMIELLRERWSGDGLLVIFVPERFVGYTEQVEWEERCLHLADVVLFYVPRDLETLPGFTTNVEWGMWHDSGRVVLGAPPDAPRNRYLFHYARKHGVPTAQTPAETAEAALREIGSGALRRGGERSVPLLVWRTPGFRRWYAAQTGAGNTLLGARLVWRFPVSYWALHVEMYVAAEDRVKSNEVVLSRADLAAVVLYVPGPSLELTRVVLVREFRSAASTADGFVHEVPGGSGPGEPLEQAVAEVAEETGLALDPRRLRAHGSRQLAATMSAHHAHVFSAELEPEELELLRPGLAGTERTFPEVVTYGELLGGRLADWSTVGMVAQVLTA